MIFSAKRSALNNLDIQVIEGAFAGRRLYVNGFGVIVAEVIAIVTAA